ncbi:MAG: hypothetical protein ACT4TC_06280, partial [Myxococcaceae bacterium]
MGRTIVALTVLAGAAAGRSESDARLASGASYFRRGEFDRALIEFKVARQLGAKGEVGWYNGAALTTQHRAEDALEAYSLADQESASA